VRASERDTGKEKEIYIYKFVRTRLCQGKSKETKEMECVGGRGERGREYV
jgi:hypothetical protein